MMLSNFFDRFGVNKISYQLFIKAGFLLLVAILSLSACSIQEVKDPPVAQLTRAETNIESAERANARENARADLVQAREKLERARKAREEEDYLTAKRLAEQAAVDAQLAEAKAVHAEQREALNQLQKGIRTLEQELNRS